MSAMLAASVAREHFAWCRRKGHSLREIAESIGMTLSPHEGEDDVILALERRWLQIREPAAVHAFHRTQRQQAKRAA